MPRFAKVLAQADLKAGGYAHVEWGAAFVGWIGQTKREHANCGKLERATEAFLAGKTDKPAIRCPIHGLIEGPEMPPALGESE